MTKPDPDARADMTALNTLLAAAREAPERPSDRLVARVLGDAATVLTDTATDPLPARPAVLPGGLLAWLRKSLGGWQGAGGLAAAACTGFWIGFSPPAEVPDIGVVLFGTQVAEQDDNLSDLSGLDWIMEEGFGDAG